MVNVSFSSNLLTRFMCVCDVVLTNVTIHIMISVLCLVITIHPYSVWTLDPDCPYWYLITHLNLTLF